MTEFIPAQNIEAKLVAVLKAPPDTFVSLMTNSLGLTYEGIPGDRHSGLTRASGAREPWYKRGTPMRNERQLSILSAEELSEVATALGIPELKPEWIGGNLVLASLANLSLLPPRSLLMFPSGAAIRIDGDNGPCRQSGRSIAENVPGRADLEFAFVKAAKRKRGLVGWVEREGEIRAGDAVKIRVWEQAVFTA
ncbi:MAG: MOSC domain-containing protein [Devosia sp.]